MRVSCDSVVALRPLTGGATVFAKNSDRPAGECQPLIQVAAADHRTGGELACQYISIEQVEHTHAFIGSRPHWLWGLEHGVNEHGVAIGNHTIFTKDAVAERGLLGMDLVRLGLERGATARAAVDVITALIERHGQGGSGYFDTVWPYHNSFLVADRSEAFLLEASARHWALRSVETGASASNHVTIAGDWSELSRECEAHAVAAGWSGGRGRFDFAHAYRDISIVPPIVSSARHAATCKAIAAPGARLDVKALKGLMRDHNGASGGLRPGFTPDDERYYSVCMHADPVGTTTASLVVELGDPTAVRPVWVAFCNPCVAPYLPVFPAGQVPADMQRGGAEPESNGAWWRFKRLLSLIEQDWERNAPLAHSHWRDFEMRLDEWTAALLTSKEVHDGAGRERALTAFMQRVWDETVVRADELEQRLRAAGPQRARAKTEVAY
jgi:secernin